MLTRRHLLAGGGSLAAAARGTRSAPAQQPNFVVIMLDDLGCTDLGCAGATDLRTPHIDAIAAAGARFTNWYSNAPVCAPARASLFTGCYPGRAGVPQNGRMLPATRSTVAALLKPAGYATGLIGKWHLGTPGNGAPNDRGFDEFYGFHTGCVDYFSHRYYWGEPRTPNYHDLWRNRTEIFEDGAYLTERLGAEAVDFIGRHRSHPFYLSLTFNAPHYPMHAPEKYKQRFAGLPAERRTYAAMISAVDDAVGLVMEELRHHGLHDNTCVFLLGDNGATTEKRAGLNGNYATAGRNGPYRGFKFSVFDGGMHVPMLMQWPARVPKGQVISETAMTMDILPTICRAAGAALPSSYSIDGTDMLALATEQAKSPHGAIFWASGGQLAVRRGPWKLVMNGFTAEGNAEGMKPLAGEDALFLSDVESDPGESRNLRRLHPQMVDELATLAQKWAESQQ